MFFIRLFLANTWEKKSGVTVLVSSQTAVKGGYGFQTGGTGARYKITSILFEVCIRDQACFRLCFYVFPLQVHKSSRKVSRFGRRIDA